MTGPMTAHDFFPSHPIPSQFLNHNPLPSNESDFPQ
jgi:hypothetical protein